MLARGGDFADGVIAFEGRSLGGEVFATFGRKAADLAGSAGLRGRSSDHRPLTFRPYLVGTGVSPR